MDVGLIFVEKGVTGVILGLIFLQYMVGYCVSPYPSFVRFTTPHFVSFSPDKFLETLAVWKHRPPRRTGILEVQNLLEAQVSWKYGPSKARES